MIEQMRRAAGSGVAPEEIEVLIARARQLRSEAMRAALRRLAAHLRADAVAARRALSRLGSLPGALLGPAPSASLSAPRGEPAGAKDA